MGVTVTLVRRRRSRSRCRFLGQRGDVAGDLGLDLDAARLAESEVLDVIPELFGPSRRTAKMAPVLSDFSRTWVMVCRPFALPSELRMVYCPMRTDPSSS